MIIKKPFDLEKALAGEPVVLCYNEDSNALKVEELLLFRNSKGLNIRPVCALLETGCVFMFDLNGVDQHGRSLYMVCEQPDVAKDQPWRKRQSNDVYSVVCVTQWRQETIAVLRLMPVSGKVEPSLFSENPTQLLLGVSIDEFYELFEFVELNK